MKIILATHHYPPKYVAGVELVAERLARWLVDRGHFVEVVCIEEIDSRPPMTVETSTQEGVVVHRLSLALAGGRLPLTVRHEDESLKRWFTEFLARAQPDIFHSLSSYLVTASLLDAARECGVPTLASLHDYWYFCPRTILQKPTGERCNAQVTADDCARCLMSERRRHRLLQGLGQTLPTWAGARGKVQEVLTDPALRATMQRRQEHLRAALKSVDRIVTPAPLTRELLLERGFSDDHVRFVRHGIRQPPADLPTSTPVDGMLRLVYMGQLAPHKGVHILIDAFQRLTPGARKPELLIYGDASAFPEYAQRLNDMASRLDQVRLAGTYTNPQVWDVLRQADVVVVPSLWFEISPLVILEAFAAGVPVIASDLRNMNTQVRREVDGLLFAAGDAASLALQLQRLVDVPELLLSLKRNIAPVRTLSTELAEIEALYESVLSGQPVVAGDRHLMS